MKRKMLILPDARLHANSFFSPVLGTTLLECLDWARSRLDFLVSPRVDDKNNACVLCGTLSKHSSNLSLNVSHIGCPGAVEV